LLTSTANMKAFEDTTDVILTTTNRKKPTKYLALHVTPSVPIIRSNLLLKGFLAQN